MLDLPPDELGEDFPAPVPEEYSERYERFAKLFHSVLAFCLFLFSVSLWKP